jgi:hypothetical protein
VSYSTICRKQRAQKVFKKTTVKLSRYVHAPGKAGGGVECQQKEEPRATKITLKGPDAPTARLAAQLRPQPALPLDTAVNGGKNAGANEIRKTLLVGSNYAGVPDAQ